MVTDTLWFCSCRLGTRWFLQLRTQPKALALCAAFLSRSSVEQPSALISYFGLCAVFRLFSLQARSWNPSSICLWSFIAQCCQCSHSLSVPGSPNTCSSWWEQTPGPCYFKRWSSVFLKVWLCHQLSFICFCFLGWCKSVLLIDFILGICHRTLVGALVWGLIFQWSSFSTTFTLCVEGNLLLGLLLVALINLHPVCLFSLFHSSHQLRSITLNLHVFICSSMVHAFEPHSLLKSSLQFKNIHWKV